jgi:hypothetical protein
MTETEKRRRGRPTKPDAERLTEKLEVRLTPAMHAKAVALGGAEWMRERITRAKLPTDGKKD